MNDRVVTHLLKSASDMLSTIRMAFAMTTRNLIARFKQYL